MNSPRDRFLKRAFDIAVSLIALLFVTPLLVLIAILVASDRRGPIFFLQRRTGQAGAVFRIYKFRTMSACEDGDVIHRATPGDARITLCGTLLRMTSMDELPQLLNVLKGEMSLVGPRPHAVAHDKIFSAGESDYALRFAAKPGLTGLAQIRGQRGDLSSDKDLAARLSSDLEYIKGWSFRGDAWIFAQSLAVPFRPARLKSW